MVKIYEDTIGVEEQSIDEPQARTSPTVFSTVLTYLLIGIAMQVGTWLSVSRLPDGQVYDLHASNAVGTGGMVLSIIGAVLLAIIVVGATRGSAPAWRSTIRAVVLIAVAGLLLWWHQGVPAASYNQRSLVLARPLQQDTVVVDAASLKDYHKASLGPMRYLVLDIDQVGEVRTRPVFEFDFRATEDLAKIDRHLESLTSGSATR